MKDAAELKYSRTSRVFTSMHGPVMWLGVPRQIAALLAFAILFDVFAARTVYCAAAAAVLWVIILVVYRHDPIFCVAMLRKPYRKVYK